MSQNLPTLVLLQKRKTVPPVLLRYFHNGKYPKVLVTSLGCVKWQQRTLNTNTDRQQLHFVNVGKNPPMCLFEAAGIPVGRVTVIVRCLIDRGSVKSDSLFSSPFGDLPCHVVPVLRSRQSI